MKLTIVSPIQAGRPISSTIAAKWCMATFM
jgi:hypothetical protein